MPRSFLLALYRVGAWPLHLNINTFNYYHFTALILVTGVDIGRLSHWPYLDRSGTPWNEVRQIPVAYAKKGLIDLIGKSQWGSEAVAAVGTYINRFNVTHDYIQI